MTRLLHDNITGGTGTAAYTGCGGQAGKTGTTDNYTDAWFAGYQPNLSTVVWVGYPQSNDIEMSSVHGITVFGGTFPAEIWNSLYSNGEIPCEEFSAPETPITWAPFYGKYTSSGGAGSLRLQRSRRGDGGEEEQRAGRGRARDAVGGYDPNAYAPGVGQEPTPTPPSTGPSPSPPSGGGGGERRGRRRHRNRRGGGWLTAPGPAGPRNRGSGLPPPAAVPLVAPGPGLVPAAIGERPGLAARGLSATASASARAPTTRSSGSAFAAYLCVLIAAPALDRRLIRGAAVVLVVAFALAPPLLSQDVFSYIAYARLGALHGLNPYTHAPSSRDPASPTSAGPNHRAPTARCSRSRPIRSP